MGSKRAEAKSSTVFAYDEIDSGCFENEVAQDAKKAVQSDAPRIEKRYYAEAPPGYAYEPWLDCM